MRIIRSATRSASCSSGSSVRPIASLSATTPCGSARSSRGAAACARHRGTLDGGNIDVAPIARSGWLLPVSDCAGASSNP
jgi:hypothetical protein